MKRWHTLCTRTLLKLMLDTRAQDMIEYALTAGVVASFFVVFVPEVAGGVDTLLRKTVTALALATGDASQIQSH